jgi:diadenosine tetraphosphate (Ap4A) HIT family hydrolase
LADFNRLQGSRWAPTMNAGVPQSAACPFCAPPASRVFYRNDVVVGIWDGYPVSRGHALLVPHRHVPTWFEATEVERVALFAALDIAKAEVDRRFKPDGYNIGMNCGAAAGQTVFHLHVHLIPRFGGDAADPRGGVRHVIPAKANYLESTAETARAPDDGPNG